MLIDFPAYVIEKGYKITGILHLGAHLAEEAREYHDTLGLTNVVWVEANKDLREKIQTVIGPYGHRAVIGRCIADVHGKEVDFHITNYDSMSSSMLEFGTHPQFSPDTVFVDHRKMMTTTVDFIGEVLTLDDINCLVMDLQGSELLALRGAVNFLNQVDYIYTEVNKDEVYINCARIEEIDDFLFDFDRTVTYWVGDQGWGDAVYVRKGLKPCS